MKRYASILTSALLSASVTMTTFAGGWSHDGAAWSFTKDTGARAANEWKQSNNEWYHFDGNGHMQTGFQQIGDRIYYFETDAAKGEGKMAKGWSLINGRWSFFMPQAVVGNPTPEGALLTGWQWIDGKCYFIDPTPGVNYGVMLANTTTADGYQLNADGQWTVNGAVAYEAGKGISTAPGTPGAAGTRATGTTSGGGGGAGGSSGGGGGSSSSGGSSSGGSSSSGSGTISSGGSSSNGNSYDYDDDDYNDEDLSGVTQTEDSGTNGYMSASQRAEVRDAIADFKDEYITSDMTDFEKEIKIVEFLVANCTYRCDDTTTLTAYSAIVNGKAQCCGYASAVMMMAEACDIPVKYVVGVNHAWNLIQIGGEWYHLDVTWEDPMGVGDSTYGFGNLRNQYINLTDAQIKERGRISHSRWTPNSTKCNATTYGPEIVEYFQRTGKLELDKSKWDDEVNSYIHENKDNLFTYSTGTYGAKKIMEYLGTFIEKHQTSVDFVVKDPTAGEAASYEFLVQLLNSELSKEYRGLFDDTPIKFEAVFCADLRYSAVMHATFVYNDMDYVIKYVDVDTNAEVSDPLTGHVIKGKSATIAVPTGYLADSFETDNSGVKVEFNTAKTRYTMTAPETPADYTVTIKVKKNQKPEIPLSTAISLILQDENGIYMGSMGFRMTTPGTKKVDLKNVTFVSSDANEITGSGSSITLTFANAEAGPYEATVVVKEKKAEAPSTQNQPTVATSSNAPRAK